jgi:tRNA modification GTPase
MANQPDDRRQEAGAQALSFEGPPATRRRAGAETIAAIATAPGRGGIGVVRLSGVNLGPLAHSLLGFQPPPRQATRARFLDDGGQALDDGLALFFPAPHSYTGEDVLELHGHGGPVIMRMLLARCLELGARIAEPGEFTQRAFLNDKLDLAQAEAVADLIDASTETAARCALRSLEGEFSSLVQGLLDQLIELRMLVEATLDFPEEEVDPVDRFDVRVRLQRLRAALARALEQGRRGSVLRSGLTIVLAGRPNVGKSSLLNRLAGEEVVIVTPVPGTTRDAVRQTVQVDGVPLNVVDTAGLRDTLDPVESLGIQRTWAAIERADLVVLVADARAGLEAADQALVARFPSRLPRVAVLNKIDLTGGQAARDNTPGGDVIRLSALTGEGMDLLRAALLEAAGWQPGGEDVFMARERHLVALSRGLDALERAERHVGEAELMAEELRLVQRDLSAITGEFGADELLGEIFSRFCIGK